MPDPLPVEETPEIPMEPSEGTPPATHVPPPPPPMPKVSFGSIVATIVVFIMLFVAGVLLSGYIRPLFSSVWKQSTVVPTPQPKADQPLAGTSIDPFASWRTSTIAGLSYKLPPEVLAPTCDGTGCVSQGTYLPGGTRFTVASRSSKAFVTDANGVAFVNKEATVSGHAATEFFGTFAGRTIGGYGFTQMHGFMIEVSPTVTLEINHFAPAGVTADFAKDDALFTQILSTLSLTAETPPVSATTSGY